MKWTYSRGHWSCYRDYPLSAREELIKEKLRLYNLIRRAKKVGMEVPTKWLIYGEGPPVGSMAFVDMVLQVTYMPGIRHMFNADSVLFSRLK